MVVVNNETLSGADLCLDAQSIRAQYLFYVYGLIDPRTGKPFYIGKGSKDRVFRHLDGRDNSNKRKVARIKEIRMAGYQPLPVILHNNMPENEAYDLEEDLILKHGRLGIEEGGILTNIGSRRRPVGVKGRKWTEEQKRNAKASYSDERRRKISEKAKGRVISQRQRDQMSLRQRGNTYRRGHTVSAETRKLISQSGKGRPSIYSYGNAETLSRLKELAAKNRAKVYLFVDSSGARICTDDVGRFIADYRTDWTYNGFRTGLRKSLYKGWCITCLGNASNFEYDIGSHCFYYHSPH